MKLTIAFTTARTDPRLPAMLDSLEPQVEVGDEIALVVVDRLGRSAADLGARAFRGSTSVAIASPKPSVWQGPQRLTKRDYWAMSSARNTAIVHASTDFVAFLDDRCRLASTWLGVVRRAARDRRAAIAGPYDKLEDKGLTIDHRKQMSPGGKPNCGGSWLYGGNFCLPLQWALDVGGFEEGCDSVGGEDYVFGTMLANVGHRIDFDVKMAADQDRTGASGDHPMPRWDKGVSPNDKSHAMNARFLRRRHTEMTPNLVELRALARDGKELPLHVHSDRDWYDNQPLSEM